MSAIGLATKGMITKDEMGLQRGSGGDGSGDTKKDPKVYFKSMSLSDIKKIVSGIEKEREKKIKIKLTLEDDETTSDK